MKTISRKCVSLKEISLSKAAKVLSKFISADNGASQAISAYLPRASASFNELDQLRKELKPSHTHKKKHKKHRTETGDDNGTTVENSFRSVETNQDLSHGHVKCINDHRRQRYGNENADEDDKKSTQTIFKSSQELNGSIEYQTGNVGGSEKHKKNKKKQHEVEASHDGEGRVKFGDREGNGKLPTREQNEIVSDREHGNEMYGSPGIEEGKKRKREMKKHKEGAKVENLEAENAKGQEQKEKGNKLCMSVDGENGGLVDPHDSQNKKKKKYEAGSENKLSEEVKMERRSKRKNEDVEESPDDNRLSAEEVNMERRGKRKDEDVEESLDDNKLSAEEVKMERRSKKKHEDVEESLDDKFGDLTEKKKKRKHEG